MTGRSDEQRVEAKLREVLRRRDPGAASFELRSRVLDIPEGAPWLQPSRPRRPLAGVLSLAAVMLLAVIGLMTIRHLGQPGIPGTTVAGGSVSIPSSVESQGAAFDPTLEGPGISSTDDLSPAILVIPACAVLGILAVTVRGRRRFLPAVGAVVLAGWALVASLMPVTVAASGSGVGLNTVWAPKVPGSAEELMYELAPAHGRFSVGLLLSPDGALPMRIEGIVSPFYGQDGYIGMLLTALWIDREPNGGMTGPMRPFTPFDMPASGQSIWLVGHAGACALGSAFDPSKPGAAAGFAAIESLDVRISVLGWPRTVHLQLPFRLVEPDPQSCGGPSPS